MEEAAGRAQQLDLSISFVQADAANLESIQDETFDLVCSTNGFFVWIANLQAVFNEVYRVLRPGGYYVFYDIHPSMRPWKDRSDAIELEKPYWETGAFADAEDGTYEYNWTLADLLNPSSDSGFALQRILESPARDSRFWQDHSYTPGTDEGLLDWHRNPRAALPVWLTVALRKPC